jgi:hypothetical protein
VARGAICLQRMSHSETSCTLCNCSQVAKLHAARTIPQALHSMVAL